MLIPMQLRCGCRRRPGQHGARYAEVVVLPGWASVDDAGLSHLGLQCLKLRVSALARRSVNNANLIGLQLGVKKFDQIGPADGVDEHRGIFDRPSLRISCRRHCD